MAIKAYVTNSGAGTVSAVNTAKDTVAATITVGTTPIGSAVTPDGNRAYIANKGSNTVSVIDTASDTVIGSAISVGTSPVGLAITPDGKYVYVANQGDGTVSVIDTASNTVVGSAITVGTSPTGIAITPDGARVYVTNTGSGTVSVISTATNTVIGSAITVGSNPYGVAISPDGTKALVANDGGSAPFKVSVIDTASNTVSTSVTVGANPQGVAISPDGTKAYVTNTTDGTVSVIDLTANPPVVTGSAITVGTSPVGVGFTPDGTKAYVANTGGSPATKLSVIDVATATVIGSGITVGNTPYAFGLFIQPPPLLATFVIPPQGRLTLSSTAPVMTADVTGASPQTIYYLPYQGATVPINNGAKFVNYLMGSSGISLALDSTAAHTGYQQSGKLFDLFAFLNNGVLTLGTGPAWTNGTTRANAITQVNGIWVNSASITLRFGTASGNTVSVAANQATYLGTMYATADGATSVQFKLAAASGGSAPVIGIWNAYNRVRCFSLCSESATNWHNSSATWVAMNSSNNNRVTYVDGLGQSAVKGRVTTIAYNATAGNGCDIGVAQNWTTGGPARLGAYQSANASSIGANTYAAQENFPPIQGLNYLQAIEASLNSTQTTFSFNGGQTCLLFEGEY